MGSGIGQPSQVQGQARVSGNAQQAPERRNLFRDVPVQAMAVDEDRSGGAAAGIGRKFEAIKNKASTVYETTKEKAIATRNGAKFNFLVAPKWIKHEVELTLAPSNILFEIKSFLRGEQLSHRVPYKTFQD